jgi:Pyrimidine dimer DNA glycosylase
MALGEPPGASRRLTDALEKPAPVRLWTVHPRYLDARGLVALWREALLAQKVLAGGTVGYRRHPQLARFRALLDPPAAVAAYLAGVLVEAQARGYAFDAAKVGPRRLAGPIAETDGQLLYEWRHLRRKLAARDPARLRGLRLVKVPEPHPLFRIVPGEIRDWEKAR